MPRPTKNTFDLSLKLTYLLYGATAMLVLFSWPLNKYEWMLDEPAPAGRPLGYCRLPFDDNAQTTPWLAFNLVAPVIIVSTARLLKNRRFDGFFIMEGAVFLLWLGKFFLLVPEC